MFAITVLILAVFLLFRLGILLVQKYHDARGAGRSFKRMLKSGALDAQVYEEAVWSEVEHFGKKRLRAKISREQQRIIRAAKTQMRDDFLDDIQPGFYQYIIIFLIASILGLVLEMVWMFVMFGIVESRVGLVWGPFSPLYGFGSRSAYHGFYGSCRKKPWWVSSSCLRSPAAFSSRGRDGAWSTSCTRSLGVTYTCPIISRNGLLGASLQYGVVSVSRGAR